MPASKACVSARTSSKQNPLIRTLITRFASLESLESEAGMKRECAWLLAVLSLQE